MQNKPNLPAPQMKVSSVLTEDYENDNTFRLPENKPNTNPIRTQNKPNFRKAKMKLNLYSTRDYNNEQRTMNYELLCKTNPIKPYFKRGTVLYKQLLN